MKPKPFVVLKNFTVPVATGESFSRANAKNASFPSAGIRRRGCPSSRVLKGSSARELQQARATRTSPNISDRVRQNNHGQRHQRPKTHRGLQETAPLKPLPQALA